MSPRKLAVVAILLTLLPACMHFDPKVWVEGEETFQIPAAGIDGLSVLTHNGGVMVQGGGQEPTIRVTVHKRAGGMTIEDAQACMEQLRIERGVRGGILELGWSWGERKQGWGATVSFDIEQPHGIPLRAETHNGSVAATALGAPCEVRTHNGSLVLRGVAESVAATTHNGSIRCEGEVRELALETHNGRIEASVAHAAGVQGRVETHNGAIALELRDGTAVRWIGRAGNGSVTGGASYRVIESGDGYLIAERGEGATPELRITTHNGSIRVD